MKKLFIYVIFLMIAASCKEKYIVPIQSPPTGYLVVEGFINSGQSATTITLTRTTRLYDSVNIINENNAIVNIEGENNEVFPLNETGNGIYVSSSLNLNAGEKYRLRIKTQNNKEYVSDFATVKHTPALDSITWTRENGGLKIYVNTHDPQNNTRYYKWDYEETWEIHSAYLSTLQYIYDPVSGEPVGVSYRNSPVHDPDTSIYRCWRSSNSTNVNIGSSEKLATDVIYLPLISIEPGSEKLSVLYSVNIKQYALSQEAYLFYEKIKKNTEQLGSIFDPQPSELQGNIHCTTDPNEPVVGYVDISEEKTERIFIGNSEVPGWNYDEGCQLTTINNDPGSIAQYGIGLTPVIPILIANLQIKTFSATEESCVDCTLRGTNIRPPFWP